MSEHTKGPWTLKPCSNGGMLLIRGDEKASISERHIQSHLQILPSEDAYLIAAAPDLLAALKAIAGLKRYGRWQKTTRGSERSTDTVTVNAKRQIWDEVDAAIAKAENRATIQSAGGGK